MPTIITHAVVGVAIAQVLAPCSRRAMLSMVAAGCAMLPDADVIGFGVGIDYSDFLGHRGFTHSLLFAVLVAAALTLVMRNKSEGGPRVFACLFAAAASHGILDAFTNGGLGVAFFSPFDLTRYFFPVRPILVSPIGLSAFLTERGLSVLLSEMLWVWTSAIPVAIAAWAIRCR